MTSIADLIAAAFGVPPVLFGPVSQRVVFDPRCYCTGWGCRNGWWHCYGKGAHGNGGFCGVPEPTHD